jgi:hypothetical protein
MVVVDPSCQLGCSAYVTRVSAVGPRGLEHLDPEDDRRDE